MIRARAGAGRAAAILLAVLMLAGLVTVLPGVPRAGAAESGGIDVAPTSVSSPVLTSKGAPLVLGFDLANTTGRDLDQVTVRVRMSQPLTLRGQLANEKAQGTPLTDKEAAFSVSRLAAGQRASGQVKINLEKVPSPLSTGKDGNATYAFTLEASAGGDSAGSARVLVPWMPNAPTKNKTQLGVLWPLVDQPRRDGTTIPDDQQTPVFEDDGLTAELADKGRLDRLVAAGDKLGDKLTWVVDPDLLDTAAAMQRGYRVAPPPTAESTNDRDARKDRKSGDKNGQATPGTGDGDTGAESLANPRTEDTTTPGTGGPVAGTWLDRLRAATAQGTVVALPYSDTDVATVAHAPTTAGTDLSAELSGAVAQGGAAAQRVLNRPVRTNLMWPIEGGVDPSIVALAKTSGASMLVASGSGMPTKKSLNYTPSARAEVGPQLDAIVTDPRIDALLAQDASAPGRKIEIQQQLIAELFTITMEDPNRQRTLLIAPPRNMSADLGEVLAQAVTTATTAAAWADIASLDSVAQSALGEERTVKPYPQELSRTEPSPRYLKAIPELQQSLATFAAILTKPERVTGPYTPAVFGTLSTAWRAPGLDAEAFRLDVARSLRVLEQLVYIAPKSGVTLSGDKGKIPVTVVNRLTQPISIRVEVTSRQPNRLSLTQAEAVTIEPGRTRAIEVEAESAANGKVLVDARLLTPDGSGAFGPGQTFYVNTTSIDGITLGIIGVIAALLLLFSLRAYLRRRRSGSGRDEGEEHHKDDGDDGPEGGPGTSGHPQDDGAHHRGDTTGHTSWDRPGDHHAPA
ncbi:DUF6049 family protein [Uniformispora flossi]|uniref:DUF6049 family protein n=1 Tax=Uniformispora flossi TaxID=3390723 RepID=UPI003C2D4988